MSPVPSGEPSSTTRIRKPSGAAVDSTVGRGVHDRLDVLGLVVCGEDQPGLAGHGCAYPRASGRPDPPGTAARSRRPRPPLGPRLIGCRARRPPNPSRRPPGQPRPTPRSPTRSPSSATSTSSTGRSSTVSPPTAPPPRPCATRRHRSPRWRCRAAPPRSRASAARCRRRSSRSPRRARSRPRRSCGPSSRPASSPSRACRASGRSGRACSTPSWGSTRSRRSRQAAEGERLRTVKGLGPKFEQSVLGAIERAEAQPADRSGRVLLPRAREIGDAIVAGLLDGAGEERRGPAGRLDPPLRGLRQGHRHRRGERRPRRAGRAARRPRGDRERQLLGPRRARAPAPTPASASTCGSATPAALGSLLQHFTGSGRAQRGAARGGRAARACTSPSTGSSTTRRGGEPQPYATEHEVYERLGLAYIEPELREDRGELEAAAKPGGLPELSSSRTSAATCTATRSPPTAATRSRRWAAPPASAATSTSRSPTTPRATASATPSRPSSSNARSS